MTLVFVRHGQSEGNAGRFVQGWMDFALTERGRAEAAAVGHRLASEPLSAIYSSTLSRAHDTARAIASHHALEIVALEGLREQGFGEAEGMVWDEIQDRWSLGPGDWGTGKVPGEEGTEAARRRIAAQFDELAARHRDDLAVCVSHGGTIGQVSAHVLGLPVEALPSVRVSNCAITVIDTHEASPVIRQFNDICHLDEASTVSDIAAPRLMPRR